MIVFGVYIVSADGRLILSEIFQNNELLPGEYILSSLLSSFSLMSKEFTGGYPEALVMGDVSYHFENFEDYFIVVVTDSRETPIDILTSLGLKFTAKFGHVMIEWNGMLDDFEEFRKTIIEVVEKSSDFDITENINPNNRLSADEVIFLPSELKSVALVLLELEKASMDEIRHELENGGKEMTNRKIADCLDQLSEMGYIGKVFQNSVLRFFV